MHVPPPVAEAKLIQGRPSLVLWFITNCHPPRGVERACLLRVAADAAEELAKPHEDTWRVQIADDVDVIHIAVEREADNPRALAILETIALAVNQRGGAS